MGPFLAFVAVPGINNLRPVNTPNSSTPAASTTLLVILSYFPAQRRTVQLAFNIFRQAAPLGVRGPMGIAHGCVCPVFYFETQALSYRHAPGLVLIVQPDLPSP